MATFSTNIWQSCWFEALLNSKAIRFLCAVSFFQPNVNPDKALVLNCFRFTDSVTFVIPKMMNKIDFAFLNLFQKRYFEGLLDSWFTNSPENEKKHNMTCTISSFYVSISGEVDCSRRGAELVDDFAADLRRGVHRQWTDVWRMQEGWGQRHLECQRKSNWIV